jgi:hypothetical protein
MPVQCQLLYCEKSTLDDMPAARPRITTENPVNA